MRALVAIVLIALLAAATGTGLAQDASPPAGTAVGLATPIAPIQLVNEEIAVELDRIFAALAVRDWDGVASHVAIPGGRTDPFTSLRPLEETGLLAISTGLVSQTVRSTGAEGTKVDLAWRLGSQLRYERWTFRRLDGRWRVVLVEPGVPLFDGVIVGIAGRIEPGGVVLPRSELVSPGGVEIRLDVAPGMGPGLLVLVFPRDACGRAEASPLTAVGEVVGDAITLSLDGPVDGDYALVLVPAGVPISRASICAATTAVVKITSYDVD